jgi:hypothetical protein
MSPKDVSTSSERWARSCFPARRSDFVEPACDTRGIGTDLDLAIALGFGALALEGTILAALTLVMTSGAQETIRCFGLAGIEIEQSAFGWAEELVV